MLDNLKRLWHEHENRRIPAVIPEDKLAIDLRYDIMEYDSQIASGIHAVLANREPLHPWGLQRNDGIMKKYNHWVTQQTNTSTLIQEQYKNYIEALDQLADLAQSISQSRHKNP